MPEDKTHLNNFVQSIFEDNYADAKTHLEAAVNEKIKTRMRSEIVNQQKTSKKLKGDK